MQVRFESVTKKFPAKKGEITAVDHLDLKIDSGKLVGLLGPSGCGKSTCLFIIAGVCQPTSGKVWFDDQEVTNLSPAKRGVGMVFQNYALYPHLTVRQNIEFPLINSKEIRKQLETKLWTRNKTAKESIRLKEFVQEEVLRTAGLVEIEDCLDRKPFELSGGQQQRVAIARAIVKQPSILLLDEPLSNLDARLRVQTRDEIRRIQQMTGITTIFVTHDQEEALNICDEIAIMKKGVLQQYGKPQDVYDSPANRFTAGFLGGLPVNMIAGEIIDGRFITEGKVILSDIPIADQPVSAGFRPENLFVSEEGKARFHADVVEMSRHGGITVVTTKFGTSGTIRLVKERADDISIGDRLALTVTPNMIYLFNSDGEKIWQQ